jgi:hypothetical protein
MGDLYPAIGKEAFFSELLTYIAMVVRGDR